MLHLGRRKKEQKGCCNANKNITYGMIYKDYRNYRECLNMLGMLRQFEGCEIAKDRIFL